MVYFFINIELKILVLPVRSQLTPQQNQAFQRKN